MNKFKYCSWGADTAGLRPSGVPWETFILSFLLALASFCRLGFCGVLLPFFGLIVFFSKNVAVNDCCELPWEAHFVPESVLEIMK